MKIFISFFLGAFLFSSGAAEAFGQYKYKDLTIILLRHAEKDKQDEEFGNSIDPRLSDAGKQRAERLADVLEKYKPDAVFSSQFNRTLSTAAPFARRKRMQVQFYNHRKLDEIAQIESVLDKYRAEEISFHALRTRRSAHRAFVSVHVLVPGGWSVQQGHDIVERIEHDLRSLFGTVTVFTHLEPIEDPVSFADTQLDREDGRPNSY